MSTTFPPKDAIAQLRTAAETLRDDSPPEAYRHSAEAVVAFFEKWRGPKPAGDKLAPTLRTLADAHHDLSGVRANAQLDQTLSEQLDALNRYAERNEELLHSPDLKKGVAVIGPMAVFGAALVGICVRLGAPVWLSALVSLPAFPFIMVVTAYVRLLCRRVMARFVVWLLKRRLANLRQSPMADQEGKEELEVVVRYGSAAIRATVLSIVSDLERVSKEG